MQHCCKFKPAEIYFLADTTIFSYRKLSIGFCPICEKPVAELTQWRFDGVFDSIKKAGIKAHNLMMEIKDQIEYSAKECNYSKFKSKPFGWKYGINRSGKRKNREVIEQYACDFYGNKELIKVIK